jgi:hypothetical protein
MTYERLRFGLRRPHNLVVCSGTELRMDFAFKTYIMTRGIFGVYAL